ncbi:sugar transferase [Terriglobus sp.]|uniref:sugar transferase n=1 Tax=Terriglobus sp. TaxID=1889013 RepID=UPI003B00909D
MSHTALRQERCIETELDALFSYRVLKRTLDFALAIVIMPLIAPLLLCIAIAVRVGSPGPIFFGHARHRDRDTLFVVWKFRTMHENSATILQNYLNTHPEAKHEWTISHKLKNDPRVTPIGHFLRRTSLDELPQIWNVLLGTMSFVGPRPITTAEIERYGDNFVSYCKVKPGITGLWQTSGRNATTYQERVLLDARYASNWSLWMDLRILLRTFRAVWQGHGAY